MTRVASGHMIPLVKIRPWVLWALARSDYDKALEIAPAARGIHYKRGMFFAEQNELAAALDDGDRERRRCYPLRLAVAVASDG
jgi:hypothetical protein